jgi:hypothetical protein
MEAQEMIIKSAMASFTEAKKDHTGFLFVKIDHLSTHSYSFLWHRAHAMDGKAFFPS